MNTANQRRTILMSVATAGALGLAVVLMVGRGPTPGIQELPGIADAGHEVHDRAVAPVGTDVRRTAGRQRAEVDGFYAAPVGTRMVFDLQSRSVTAMGTSEEPAAQQIAQTMRGQLEITVVDRDDAGVLVAAVRCLTPEFSMVAGGHSLRAEHLREAYDGLSATSWLRMDGEGRILGIGFDRGTPEPIVDLMRAVLVNHVFVMPAEAAAGKPWEVDEVDTAGPVRVRYAYVRGDHAAGGDVSRVKLEREHKIDEEAALMVPEIDSRIVGTADPRLGWMVGVRVTERYRSDFDTADMVASGSFELVMKLASQRNVSPVELGALASELEQAAALVAWRSVAGTREENRASAHDAEFASWSAHLKDKKTDALLKDLIDVLGHRPIDRALLVETQTALIWKMRIDDEALPHIAGLLRESGVPAAAEGVLVAALGAVQTDAAQSTLADFVSDSGLPEHLRVESVVSMVQIAEPKPELVDVLRGRAFDEKTPDSLQRTSRLALGAMAQNDTGLLQELLAHEADVQAPRDTANWLDALGNTRAPQTLTTIGRYMDHADASVRESAVLALANNAEPGDPAAQQVMARRLGRETDPRVRNAVIASLASSRGEVSDRAILGVMQDTSNVPARLSALEGLSRRDDSFARQVIERASQSDPDQRVRDAATSLKERN